MDFIVEQQAKFSVDIELLKEAQKSLTEAVNILQSEMREGFNNLIAANEVTRKLSEDVARLAIQTSRRVDVPEGRS